MQALDLQEKVNELFTSHSELDLNTRLEIIANYFLQLGLPKFKSFSPENQINTLEEALAAFTEEKTTYGESIYTALVSQALIIFIWLENSFSEESEEEEAE